MTTAGRMTTAPAGAGGHALLVSWRRSPWFAQAPRRRPRGGWSRATSRVWSPVRAQHFRCLYTQETTERRPALRTPTRGCAGGPTSRTSARSAGSPVPAEAAASSQTTTLWAWHGGREPAERRGAPRLLCPRFPSARPTEYGGSAAACRAWRPRRDARLRASAHRLPVAACRPSVLQRCAKLRARWPPSRPARRGPTSSSPSARPPRTCAPSLRLPGGIHHRGAQGAQHPRAETAGRGYR
jgi:hypothetical protein